MQQLTHVPLNDVGFGRSGAFDTGTAIGLFNQLLRLGAAPTLCCTEAVGVAGGGATFSSEKVGWGFGTDIYRKSDV